MGIFDIPRQDKSQWRRRTDFSNRPRHLYALVFESERAVYVGQSIDPKRRYQQHAATGGGWLRTFRMVGLETIEGTFAQAEVREYVWRWVAHTKGWTVYVQPPNVVVNLGRRMPWWRRLEAWRTRFVVGWPI
jgi:predicted GIY-YIG superfamily endonuclease